MKFMATSPFRNTHKFRVNEASTHPMQIDKGNTFEADETDATLGPVLAQLGAAGRIIDVENQPKVGEQLLKEVDHEKRKEAELNAKTAGGKK